MTIRQAKAEDAAGIAEVHVDTWRSTYRGIVSAKVLDGLSYEDREQMWQSALTTDAADNYIYVAEDDDDQQIVGFVAAGAEHERETAGLGEIYALYLLQEYQGRGLGKELFLRAADRLSREGYDAMILWVLADNPTRGFYEAMDGTATRTQEINLGGDVLEEVAYEWESLRGLAK